MTSVKVLYLLLYFFILLGAWLIASTLLGGEKLKHEKIIKMYTEHEKKRSASSGIDAGLEKLSRKFAKFIHINDIRRSEMEKSLYMIGSSQTPEEYMAYAFTIAAIVLVIGLLMFLISKIFGVLIIGCAVIAFVYVMRKLSEGSRGAVKVIERELPKFVAYLKQAFLTNSNVIYVLDEYKTSNAVFARELGQTLADAKTSNFDSALARLDQRVNSSKLKMVISGLQSAYNGDDVKIYFAMLEKDFNAFEVSELKKDIKSIPQQLTLPKLLIYASAAFALLLPLALTIMDSFSLFFESGAGMK
jgi:hypothetical protein